MVLAYTPTPPQGGMCLPQGYAGGRGDSSKPIPVVQCGCSGLEEGCAEPSPHQPQPADHPIPAQGSDSGHIRQRGGRSQ